MTIRSDAVRAFVVALAMLVVLAAGPVGVAMAEAPTVTIASPADGSSTTEATPSFSGTSSEAFGPVVLRIYPGASAAGAPVEESSTFPAEEAWTLTPAPLGEGTYTAIASQTNALLETGESAALTFTIDAAPVITENPAGATVQAGENAVFTAAASGTPAPAVQWEVSTDSGASWAPDATDIGNTTTTLTVASTAGENGYEYRAVFTNTVSSAASTAASLEVQAPPQVTTNPVSTGVIAGESAVFTAAASGTPTPSVQWEVSTDFGSTWSRDMTDMGHTTGKLTVVAATLAQNGYEYRAVFRNSVGLPATSAPATLTVSAKEAAPVPTTPPATAPASPTAPVDPTAPASPSSPSPSPSPVPSPPVSSPPVASFQWFPPAPHTGEPVSLASTSIGVSSPITGFAWDPTGAGAFNAGQPVLTTSFATPGDHLVRLRVTDADGLSSTVAEGIAVSAPTPTLMQPFPVVRIVGTESSSGVRVSLLTVQAPVGATVRVSCHGPGCSAKSQDVVADAGRTKGNSRVVLVTFRRFERALRAGAVLQIRISEAGQIGKYTRFAIRRDELPARLDECLSPTGIAPIACPSS